MNFFHLWFWPAVILRVVLKNGFVTWLFGMAVFYQFFVMIYHWDNPDVNAGWVYLGYLSLLYAVVDFTTLFDPIRYLENNR
ncbi:MAG: hypothetical protein H0V39_00150 [Nitrosomonas sp.]|nr:hypothetical protein [Nitrosomonas sp.]